MEDFGDMVFVEVDPARAAGLGEHLSQHGVLVTGHDRLRFVTHLDVDAAGVDRAAAAVRAFFAA